jgi:CMP-N-acetylneuraminic acid synthetase
LIVFIPIKENSQRVKRKNFRLVNGAPLYKHVVRKLKDHKVFISTDSQEILRQCKIDPTLSHTVCYARDQSLCGDKVSVCDILEDFINKFDIIEPIVQMHVTNPFLKIDTVESAYDKMGKHDSVVSCNTHQTRFWRKESYGFCPINHNPGKLEQTQDLPVYYEENSSFYIFNPNVIFSGNRVGQSPLFFPIEFPENLDIDTESDWDLYIKLQKIEKKDDK